MQILGTEVQCSKKCKLVIWHSEYLCYVSKFLNIHSQNQTNFQLTFTTLNLFTTVKEQINETFMVFLSTAQQP